jgi:hypothetical protein
MTINLSGVIKQNPINLTGKSLDTCKPIIIEIDKLKKRIISDYMIPLYSKQWDILNENVFLMDRYVLRLEALIKTHKTEELSAYINLLKIIKILVEEHNLLVFEEQKHYKQGEANNITSMMIKIPQIKLLPEYEIYNSILGKPNGFKKESYNDLIINDIKLFMTKKDITYQIIKTHIHDNYIK